MFQSTPPAEARGDDARRAECAPKCFQSTPPAEARGDDEPISGERFLPPPKGRPESAEVSIHSPRRSEGRQPTPEGRIQQ